MLSRSIRPPARAYHRRQSPYPALPGHACSRIHASEHWNKVNSIHFLATLGDIGTFDESDSFTPLDNAARSNAIGAHAGNHCAWSPWIKILGLCFFAARENHMDIFALLFDKWAELSRPVAWTCRSGEASHTGIYSPINHHRESLPSLTVNVSLKPFVEEGVRGVDSMTAKIRQR